MPAQHVLQSFTMIQKSNLESGLTLANALFGGVERLVNLNLNTARNVLDEASAKARTLENTDALPEMLTQQSAWQQPAMEKSLAYWRGVHEIAAQTQEEVSKLMESQMAELMDSVTATLDKLAKSGPSGSVTGVAAMKSAMTAFNSAFDSMNKTAKQVSELTEANMAAATDVTVKAISTQGTVEAAAPKSTSRKAA